MPASVSSVAILVTGYGIAAGAAAVGAMVLGLPFLTGALAALLAVCVAGVYAVFFVEP